MVSSIKKLQKLQRIVTALIDENEAVIDGYAADIEKADRAFHYYLCTLHMEDK